MGPLLFRAGCSKMRLNLSLGFCLFYIVLFLADLCVIDLVAADAVLC